MRDIFKPVRPLRYCGARTQNGRVCKRWAVEGEYFCALHLSQGYGLFTGALKIIRKRGRERTAASIPGRLKTEGTK